MLLPISTTGEKLNTYNISNKLKDELKNKQSLIKMSMPEKDC